jgi:hypothetical protein
MMKQLELVLTHLARLFERSGKKIILALEPEPGCLLETTEEVCRFFERLRFGSRLWRHLAICYDCCHQAVQFEDPARSLHDLAAAGVPLAKVQVSSALKLKDPDSATRFDEPRYLHQVVVRHRDGGLSRYRDLPDAISSHEASAGDEWRCHFHVPIFSAGYGAVQTTRDFVTDVLPLVPEDVLLEVETYTWEVLPEELRTGSVTDSIIREISWLKEQLHA